jgi:hypothetical protein
VNTNFKAYLTFSACDVVKRGNRNIHLIAADDVVAPKVGRPVRECGVLPFVLISNACRNTYW